MDFGDITPAHSISSGNSKRITFGKYKGDDIDVIIEKDRQYAKWLSNSDYIKYPFYNWDLSGYIVNKLKETDTTTETNDPSIIMFGRNKGKNIDWIKENDAKYLYYLAKNDYVKSKYPELSSMATEIIKNN